MHIQPVSDLDGKFGAPRSCDNKCPKCNSPMTMSIWTSDCGGFEDEKYDCNNCGHYFWFEGPDS